MRAEPSVEPPSATTIGRVPAAWQRRSSALWSSPASLKTGTTIPMEGSRGWPACVPRHRVRWPKGKLPTGEAVDALMTRQRVYGRGGRSSKLARPPELRGIQIAARVGAFSLSHRLDPARSHADLGHLHSTRRRTQTADVVDQMPNLLVLVNLAEARHAAQANAVLDDPEKLAVGALLYLRRVQSKCAWIHPPANIGRRAAVNAVTVRALAAIGHLTDRHATRVMRWRLRQRPPGAPRDDPELGLGGQVSLHSPRLVERAQAEVIQGNRGPGGEEQQCQKEKEQTSTQHQSPPRVRARWLWSANLIPSASSTIGRSEYGQRGPSSGNSDSQSTESASPVWFLKTRP